MLFLLRRWRFPEERPKFILRKAEKRQKSFTREIFNHLEKLKPKLKLYMFSALLSHVETTVLSYCHTHGYLSLLYFCARFNNLSTVFVKVQDFLTER